MDKVKSWSELLKWHQSQHNHPIFNPLYARENLISLAETAFVLWFCIFCFGLFINGLLSFGLLKEDTMLVMISENILRYFYLNIFSSNFANLLINLVVYTVVFLSIRNIIEIYKALEHPKE